MNRYFKAIVLENSVLNNHFRLLTIEAERIAIDARPNPVPGQFYMLQAGNTYDPLLKRPFSIFRYEDGLMSFLYRVRGKGTLLLSSLKKGDIIDVIGPLGNGYPEPEGDFIAVAGGIGIASLFPLLSKFKNRAYLFYGARNKQELVMIDEAKTFSKESFVATDDGSEGHRGTVTDLLKSFLNSSLITHHSSLIYACGPSPMLKELLHIVVGEKAKCYISLEEHMACGVGACIGCVVKTVSGYKRVCKEGPVFEIREIVWNNGVMK
ncbi:dihydroorotate dehydrogenase B (NAD(+)), electron transfer subunit [Dissulfurispira thermophila]|uniref:Dihydroorotate dehydrogenase B (NAD(+)), electron transfer subunit n=2 Tax=root TaxID=1 RepID=A0A7G1H2K8_9BACT|nr:dihydroorotate dehydrogenase electron transfer subunit [Dissulfurispira thermophila]BCB96419.1 dihydroorotate dehydrogenase B (NAD(+)), electron transfer subunit [Dissulfurispira thermophila]